MSNDTAIEVTFPKLNHFWLDSGLLGLYELLHEAENGTLVTLDDSKLTMRGKEEAIEAALASAYDELVKKYYDLSTKRQRDTTTSIQLLLRQCEGCLRCFSQKEGKGHCPSYLR